MKCYLIHNTDTVGISSWYIEQAYRKTNNFKLYRPNRVMSKIISDKVSPPDYFLIWEGNISDLNCTKDLADIKVPKVMWFSDSYPVPGYMDYFPFEVAWANKTKPDIILMAQRGKIEDMKKATGVPTYWLPFAGSPEHHQEVITSQSYDVSYSGTINPNMDHADQLKAEMLSKIASAGFKIRATISHSGGNSTYGFEWKLGRPILHDYSKTVCMGKIGFNCNIAGELTMRTFEIPLMNRVLLTNGGDSWDKIFAEWDNIMIYDKKTLVERTKILVDNPDMRQTMAKQAREIILHGHTYDDRIKQIEMIVDNKIDEYEKSIGINK